MGTRLQREAALRREDHAPTRPCDEWWGLPLGCAGEGVRGALCDGETGREGGDGWRDWGEGGTNDIHKGLIKGETL